MLVAKVPNYYFYYYNSNKSILFSSSVNTTTKAIKVSLNAIALSLCVQLMKCAGTECASSDYLA